MNEAMRLMEMSKQSLYDDEQSTRCVCVCVCVHVRSLSYRLYRAVRPIDAIYGVIREMSDPDTVR